MRYLIAVIIIAVAHLVQAIRIETTRRKKRKQSRTRSTD